MIDDIRMMKCTCFVQVTVEQRDRAMNVSQEVRTGVLFMVDLAGSERAAVTQVIVHMVIISTVAALH